MIKTILSALFILVFPILNVSAESLKMGYLGNFWALQPAIVKANGWDKELGLDIEYTKFSGPAGLLQAFSGGKLDSMNNNLPSSLLALNQGKHFKLISSLIHGDITLIGKSDFLQIKGKQDMLTALIQYKEKLGHPPRIVTNSYGSVSQILISYWFKNQCPECLNNVAIKYAADGNQLQQIYLSGNAEFISAFEPYTSIILEKTNDSSIILKPTDFQTKQPGSALVVSSEYLEKNPQTAEKLRKLWQRAQDFIKTNPEQSIGIIDKEITAGLVEKEILAKALQNITPYLMSDPKESILLIKELKKFMCQEKYLSCDIEVKDLSYE